MMLIDTSAWVEFLRATGSSVHRRVRVALEQDVEVVSTDVVVMELLAGARDDDDRDELRRLLYRFPLLAVQGPSDCERAAELYRACRAGGETPRKLTDCLIAAVAIRCDAELLHSDADFLTIARHAPLRLVPQ
jgi:predicted nucleic acid-binding protein